MADSRRLQIRKAMVAALRGIPGVQPTSVIRDPINPTTVPLTNLPLFILGTAEPLQREWQRGAQEGGRRSLSWIMEHVLVPVYAVADASGDGDGPKDDALENMVAALETALTPEDYTFGGLVTDMRLRQPNAIVLGQPNAWRIIVEQEVEITFQRQYGVP